MAMTFFPPIKKQSKYGIELVMKKIPVLFAVLGFVAFNFVQSANASDQIPGRAQSQPIAITGADIYPVSSAPISAGTIVFEDGKITRIGKEIALPANCQIIRSEGKRIYPGLVEAYSNLGLVEINSVRATVDYREVGDNNANVRAVAAFNPDSEIIPVNRSNGILLAVSAPSGGTIAGRSSLMMLDGWTWEDMTLKADVGMHIDWPRSDDGIAEIDGFIDDARRYVDARKDNAEQPRDLRLEALARVLDGSLPVIVDATSVNQIRSAVSFASKNGLKLIILGGYDAHKCAKLLKSNDVPVIVSGVYRNPQRRHEAYDQPYSLPGQLHSAGIKFCISAGGRFGANGLRNLPYNAATAAAYGLDEAEALRSITLSPAEILGAGDQVGSLEVGKDATLFIADGDILETPTQVLSAFIQGRAVDLDDKHKQLYRKYTEKYRR